MKNKLIIWLLTVIWAYLTWHLTTTPNLVVAPETLLNTIIMMGGHFTFFGMQALFLSFNLSNFASIILASGYGLAIELVQRHIPGRSADPIDWLLDTLGAITFLVIMNKLYSYKSKLKA